MLLKRISLFTDCRVLGPLFRVGAAHPEPLDAASGGDSALLVRNACDRPDRESLDTGGLFHCRPLACGGDARRLVHLGQRHDEHATGQPYDRESSLKDQHEFCLGQVLPGGDVLRHLRSRGHLHFCLGDCRARIRLGRLPEPGFHCDFTCCLGLSVAFGSTRLEPQSSHIRVRH